QVTDVTPVAPRRIEPRISRDLDTISRKCLEKFPDLRYKSAKELAEDLALWRANKPIKARPVGPTGHAYRWCRRNPALAAVSSAAMLAVVLSGGIYAAYLTVQESKRFVEDKNKELESANEEQGETIAANKRMDDITSVPQMVDGGQHQRAKEILENAWK